MSDGPITKRVFLDTEIFDRQQLFFRSKSFECLVRLAFENEIEILLTTVTASEIRKHIDEKAAQAYSPVKDVRRFSRYLTGVIPPDALYAMEQLDEAAVKQALHDQFDRFITGTGAQVLPINAEPQEIFDKYFKQEPPFGTGPKKKEFPDAFVAATLARWCEDRENAKLYVVSGDPDFKRACQGNGNLIHIEGINELLELFAEPLLVASIKEGVTDEVADASRMVEDVLGDMSIIVIGDVPDGEINRAICDSATVIDLHVLEAKDGHALVTGTCMMRLSLDAVADDPDSGIKDSETKTIHYVYRMSGTIERECEKDVTIVVSYDPESPVRVDIEDFTFDDNNIYVTIEEGELTRDDDWDQEDVPMS